ncbi:MULTISPECIES: tRNA (adenosine(37)-N6)-dimethylallyltransferase MiaA [Helcococcus]|uniref:tRNA dimethylallyltransferase n=1 Tax=Helcococcus bovis TaxID=3153252 RepID=A0ABW9F501_9FIRM
MKKVIIIAGPTAVGKTNLSIKLAKKLNTEIISADSMQIYKKLDIGTAKVTKEEMNGIKHYMIDIINPDDNYSVQQFKNDALDIINKLHDSNKIPIIVGGTGLYIDSLTHDFDFVNVKPNYDLRNKLENTYDKNPEILLDQVHQISEKYTNLTIKDKKKIIRAIEVYQESGKILSYDRKQNSTDIKYYLYVLNDDREDLYKRINSRVDKMIEKGLIEEVKSLLFNGLKPNSQSMKAIGYKEVLLYLNGEYTLKFMIEKLKQNSRHYAKRQLTWFRRNELSNWIDIKEKNTDDIVDYIIKDVL